MRRTRPFTAESSPRAAASRYRHPRAGVPELCVALLLLVACMVVFGMVRAPRAGATSLAVERVRAKAISQQIATLDARLAGIVNQYASATARLASVDAQIARNEHQLKVAAFQVSVARKVLSARAVAMYKERSTSIVDVLVGSSSFADMLSQLTFLSKLSQYDDNILGVLQSTRQEVADRELALTADRQAASTLIAQQTAERARIRTALLQRQTTLHGLQTEIKRLEAELRKPVVKVQKVAAVTPAAPTGEGAPSGGWWPAIKDAGAANGISADGLYRLMMIESGGNASIVGGSGGRFCGLFQYFPGTWKGSWNPWRGESIFSGVAQIKATAFAIKMGKGPSWWSPSYQWAFGTSQ
jgi:predicted  nucleic acid-binding Zn-ribbon protein